MFELLFILCGCFCMKWGKHCNSTKVVTTKRIMCHFQRILSIDTRDQIQIIIIHRPPHFTFSFIRMQVGGKDCHAMTTDELVNHWIITIRFYSLILKWEFLFISSPHSVSTKRVRTIEHLQVNCLTCELNYGSMHAFFLHWVRASRAHTHTNKPNTINYSLGLIDDNDILFVCILNKITSANVLAQFYTS